MSGIVNRAYGTLTNPYTRAEYILQLQGVTIGESDNVDDTALIMEVMESREELDNAETREEVDRIRRDNLGKLHLHCQIIAMTNNLSSCSENQRAFTHPVGSNRCQGLVSSEGRDYQAQVLAEH